MGTCAHIAIPISVESAVCLQGAKSDWEAVSATKLARPVQNASMTAELCVLKTKLDKDFQIKNAEAYNNVWVRPEKVEMTTPRAGSRVPLPLRRIYASYSCRALHRQSGRVPAAHLEVCEPERAWVGRGRTSLTQDTMGAQRRAEWK